MEPDVSPASCESPATRRSSELSVKGGRTLKAANAAGRESNHILPQLEVDRTDFVEQVRLCCLQHEAFFTLPFTVLQLVLFMVLVVERLRVHQRQELESALQDWVVSYGQTLTGPFISEHVADASTFWDWLNCSGLAAVYGGRQEHVHGARHLQIATTNVLVGDVLLSQRRADDAELSSWLLHSSAADAYLTANPLDYLGAARQSSTRLREAGWLDDSTAEVRLRFSSFCERAAMFALTEVTVDFSRVGLVTPRVVATAVPTFAVPKVWTVGFDAAYLVLILYKLLQELKEMWRTVRHGGCKSFAGYWSVWNFVDWADVLLGCSGSVRWFLCWRAVQAEALHRLLDQDSKILTADVMRLSVNELEEAHQDIARIKGAFVALHMVFSLNMVAIMAKFFKAFQANPRLKVVTDTLLSSFQDIVHFMVVFITVFLSFAVIGHVLFGSDLVEFYTTSSAVNTGFFVLMGEFTWYVDIQSTPDGVLHSGLPLLLLQLWFFCYMFFVLLVLLNMLLAILLGHYNIVTLSSKGSQTLWEQFREYLAWRLATRGHLSLQELLLQVDNGCDPADQEESVSADSLQDAFPKMKRQQADFLMMWLQQKKLNQQCDGGQATDVISQRNEVFVHHISEYLRELSGGVAATDSRLSRLEEALIGKGSNSPAEGG